MIDSLLLRADLWFYALLAGLYLTDLARLLAPDEVLLTGSARGHFRALTPQHGFLFNRRHAVFPAVLRPDTHAIRLRWPPAASGSDTRAEVERVFALGVLAEVPRMLCPMLLVLMFVVLPVTYIVDHSETTVIITLGMIYLSIVVLVGWMVRQRVALGFGPGQVAWLAFESLLCPPYAINLYRKIQAAHHGVRRADVLDVATDLLPPERRQRLHEELRAMLATRRPEEDTPGLAAWRARLDAS